MRYESDPSLLRSGDTADLEDSHDRDQRVHIPSRVFVPNVQFSSDAVLQDKVKQTHIKAAPKKNDAVQPAPSWGGFFHSFPPFGCAGGPLPSPSVLGGGLTRPSRLPSAVAWPRAPSHVQGPSSATSFGRCRGRAPDTEAGLLACGPPPKTWFGVPVDYSSAPLCGVDGTIHGAATPGRLRGIEKGV